jgi:type III restriction enzyme
MFSPEYAEVYGVPFSFIPCSGSASDPRPGPMPTRVRALEERSASEINFPRLLGYRYELPSEKLSATFTEESKLSLSTADLPTRVENAPIVGESSIHTLDDLKQRREQEVAFLLAKLVLEKYFRQDGAQHTTREASHQFDSEVQAWLFPQVLHIANRWLRECVICKDNTFPQLLLLLAFAHDAADRIYHAIIRSQSGETTLLPILQPYDALGSTRYVDFDTTRPTYLTEYTRRQRAQLSAGLYRAPARSTKPCDEFDYRSHRRKEERQGRQSRDRGHALGAGGQQPRWFRALGVFGNCGSVGREECDANGIECINFKMRLI